MSKRTRRKKAGVIGTLFIELSALAGVFGISQPAMRNHLWLMIQPAANPVRSHQQIPQVVDSCGSQPESNLPTAYLPETYQSPYPSAYTARAVKPRDARNPSGWNASGYNPMGTYQ